MYKGRLLNATTAQLPADPYRRETESVLFSQILVGLVINSVVEHNDYCHGTQQRLFLTGDKSLLRGFCLPEGMVMILMM